MQVQISHFIAGIQIVNVLNSELQGWNHHCGHMVSIANVKMLPTTSTYMQKKGRNKLYLLP